MGAVMGYAELVNDAVSQGIPRAVAEKAIRAQLGVPAPVDPVVLARQMRDAKALEKEEQRVISNHFRVCGFKVYNLSQARASKQSPGIPDLWIVHTIRANFALWWESKRQVGGKYSDAQIEFRQHCELAGTRCLGGDRYDAQKWLVFNGFAYIAESGEFEPVQFDLT